MKRILFFMCGMTMISSAKALDLSGTIADTAATIHLSTPDFYDLIGDTTLTAAGATATLTGTALSATDYINLDGNALNSAATTLVLEDTEIRDSSGGTLNIQNITLTDSVIDFYNTTWTNSNSYTLTFQGTSSYTDSDNALSVDILQTDATAADVDGSITLSGDFAANTIQDTGANYAYLEIDAANIDVSTINLDGLTDLTLFGQAIKVANFTKTGENLDMTLDSLNSIGVEGNINWTDTTSNIESFSGGEIDLYTATTNISGADIAFYSDVNLHNTATLNLTGSDLIFDSTVLTIEGSTLIGESAAATNFEDGIVHFQNTLELADWTVTGANLSFTNMDTTVDGVITMGELSSLTTSNGTFTASSGITVGAADTADVDFGGTSSATVNGITLSDLDSELTLRSEFDTTITGNFTANEGTLIIRADSLAVNNAFWDNAIVDIYSYAGTEIVDLIFDGTTDFEDTQFTIYDDTSFSPATLTLRGTDFVINTADLMLNSIATENVDGSQIVEFSGDDGLSDFVTITGSTTIGGLTELSISLLDFATDQVINNGHLSLNNATLDSGSIVNTGSNNGGEITTDNTVNINSDIQNTDGYLTVNTGTTTINGEVLFASNVLNDNSLLVATGATLNVDALSNTGTLNYDVDNLRTGSFINSGALTVLSQDFGFNGTSISKTVENSGTVTLTGNTSVFNLNAGETIENTAAGIVSITEAGLILTNNGSITGGEIIIDAVGANFINESVIDSDLTITTGTYTENTTGVQSINSNIDIGDGGTFEVAAGVTTFTFGGQMSLSETATLNVLAGAFVIDSTGRLTVDGANNLELAGIDNQGQIYTELGTGDLSITGGTFTNSGQIIGDQTLIIDATGTWQQDGNLFSLGLDVTNNGIFAFDPAVAQMSVTNRFANNGTVSNGDTVALTINGGTWIQGAATLDLSNLLIMNGGTFELSTDVTDLNTNVEGQNATLDLNENDLDITGNLNLKDSVIAMSRGAPNNNINVTGNATLNNVGFDFADSTVLLNDGDAFTLLHADGTLYSKSLYVTNWDDILNANLVGIFSQTGGDLALEAIAEMTYETITPLSINNSNMASVMTLMQDVTNRSVEQNQLLMHFATLANDVSLGAADASELAGALEQIRPQNIDAAVRTSAFLDNAVINQISNHIDSNARYARIEENFTPPVDSVWFDVSFNGLERERTNDFKAYESKGGTVSIGRETALVKEHIFGGIVGSLSRTETTGQDEGETDTAFEIESQSLSISTYMQMISKFISFYGATGASFQTHDMERTTFLNKTARSNYDTLNYFGKVGAEISLLHFLIPGASLTHHHLEGISYTEQGADGETMNVSGDDVDLTHFNLSLRFQLEFKKPGLTIIPYIKGETRRLISEPDGVTFTNSFTEENGLPQFTNTTNEFEEELTIISAGVDIFETMSATKTTLLYQMQESDNGSESQVSLQINIMF